MTVYRTCGQPCKKSDNIDKVVTNCSIPIDNLEQAVRTQLVGRSSLISKKDLSIDYINRSEFCIVWTTRISFLDALSAVPPFLLKRDFTQSTYSNARLSNEHSYLPMMVHCKLKRAITTPNSVSALLGPKLFWPYEKAILALESWIGTHGAILGMEESQIGPTLCRNGPIIFQFSPINCQYGPTDQNDSHVRVCFGPT